jgi:hypothetical protein
MTLRFKLALAAALLLPLPAAAHHGWSGQDMTKVTTLEGSIQAVRYRDPHAEIDLMDHGQMWTITLAPTERMDARGVTPAVLKVGQSVKIDGHRNLDQKRFEVKANDITIGGKTTNLR